MNLENKVVLITGASSGIGAAAAIKFAKEGAVVAINFLSNQDGAERTKQEIESAGGKAEIFQADVSKESEAKELIKKVIETYGTLDILVNNAGKYISEDEWNGSFDSWQQTIEVNLFSTLNCSKFASEYFIEKQMGVIVNVATKMAHDPAVDAIAYGAAKAGVINATIAFAKLLAPFGRVNSVSPGTTRSGYWVTAEKEEIEEHLKTKLLHKIAEPEDIANTIVFLASDNAKMITAQDILVDGGNYVK